MSKYALSIGACLLVSSCSQDGAGTDRATAEASPLSASALGEESAERTLPGFHDGYVHNGDIRIHYVAGGRGPGLVLVHGWPETWYAWAKLMPALAKDHTVFAVDLRGLGASDPAPSDAGGYVALALASDLHALVTQLKLAPVDIAGHDWGGQVALAYAFAHRAEVRKLAVFEAPPSTTYTALVKQQPDVFWWDWFISGPKSELSEQLVAGREETFYRWFYANSGGAISPAAQQRYIRAYGRPGSSHAGFELFRQQDQGESDVDALLAKDGPLTIPVLAGGGDQSLGPVIGKQYERVASNVIPAAVPNTNHWVMEENPDYVLQLLSAFFAR